MVWERLRQDKKVLPSPASDKTGWWGNAVSASPEQRRSTTKKTETEKTIEETTPGADVTEKAEQIKGDMDRVIDEIDEVLEENAEEFVKNYIQRGGE